MRWSKNVLEQFTTLHPVKMDAKEFNPAERSFPFADTPLYVTGIKADVKANEPVEALRTAPFIEVGEGHVTFRMQRGPVKEHGVNGCQIDDIITFALGTIQVLNKKFPCRENALAITKLEEALQWLEARTRDRQSRGVEGRDQD
jgi:hypothetical protein